jgi:hypothetical protein
MHAVFQTINFRFVPNRQRILYDNVTSLMWKTALSFISNSGSSKASVAETGAGLGSRE